jgi:hypothetical protein
MKAINDNTEESLRSIISEPSPGVLTFEMLQPRFCELLVAEVNSTTCNCTLETTGGGPPPPPQQKKKKERKMPCSPSTLLHSLI